MWILLGILCATIPLGIVAAIYMITFNMPLESLGDNPILQTTDGTPISEIPSLDLYIGESDSTYFRLFNNDPSDIDIQLYLSFSTTNFEMVGDPEFGYRVGEGGWLTANQGDLLTIPFGSYLEFNITILNIDASVGTGYNATLDVNVID